MYDNQIPMTVSNEILTDAEALRKRLNADGYLFFRELIPSEEVLAVRRRVLEYCRDAGWLREGAELMEGISDHEPLKEGGKEWLPVYAKVQAMEEFHRLKMTPAVAEVIERVFDEPVVALPNTVGRLTFPNDNERLTPAHQDWLYIQGSVNTVSCWSPLGDVPREQGGLTVQVGSHKAGMLTPRPSIGIGGNVVETEPGLPWAVTDYRAGDVLMFVALTAHAALPNRTTDRMRISIDFRYVGQSHAIADASLPPHFYWAGEPFTWDTLTKGWKDRSLVRYWEKLPLRIVPHDSRWFAKIGPEGEG